MPLDQRRAPFAPAPRAPLAGALGGVLLLGAVLPGCSRAPEEPAPVAADEAPGGGLPDRAAERGLDYVNVCGTPAKRDILEANGAGVALLDLGRDGDLDVVFAQGLASLEQLATGPGADLAVYENTGGGQFRPVAGPGLSGWWTGLATGDVDSDGDPDLVAGGFGDLRLLLQDGAGRLVERPDCGLAPEPARRLVVGEERTSDTAPLWPTSLALFDGNRDGRLDLYVGCYLDLDPTAPPRGALGEGALAVPCRWKGHEVYCGPAGMVPQADRVYRGRGDGTFREVTEEWLPNHTPGYTLGVLACDLDGDLDTDLFVANDSSPNLLLVNEDGRFVDRGYEAGVALSQDGRAEAGMGVAFGDVDHDGTLDLTVTNFSGEPTALYLGSPTGFQDVTYRSGLHGKTRNLLSWGVHLVDFDADGVLELFTANGHVYPQADEEHTGTTYAQRDTLFRLPAAGRVELVEPAVEGSILALERGTRGTAVGDVDGDGDVDIVLSCIDAPAALGINTMGADNRRLSVRCLGTGPKGALDGTPKTPLDGRGTRVAVVVGPPEAQRALLGEVQTAVGYQSASSPWLHFGLGREDTYEKLLVWWPSGRVQELPGGSAGRRLVIREGVGIVEEEVLR